MTGNILIHALGSLFPAGSLPGAFLLSGKISETDIYGNRDLGTLVGVTNAIAGLIKNTPSAILSVVIPLAALILLYNLVVMMTSHDQRKVETSRAWLIRTAIVLVMIIALPFIVNFIRDIGRALSGRS